MADGSTKPLGQVKVGDKVEATDPATGKTAAQTVTTVWVNHDTDLMDVTVVSGGVASTIHATQHHLFWDATRHAWTEADQLNAGDQLRTDDGAIATVAATVVIPGAADMWDLTVHTSHDFYVVTAAVNVLVHNCPSGDGSAVSKADSPVWRSTSSWRGGTRTNGLSGSDREYYEWDYTHNDIEVYGPRGNHLGSMDPNTGEMTKPSVPGRRINVR